MDREKARDQGDGGLKGKPLNFNTIRGKTLTLMSFGFKYGQPEANNYFDVTFIKNPARQHDKGWDFFSKPCGKMVEYVIKQADVEIFLVRVVPLIAHLARLDVQKVAFGCNSGRHRSPIIVEEVAKQLFKDWGVPAHVEHRDAVY